MRPDGRLSPFSTTDFRENVHAGPVARETYGLESAAEICKFADLNGAMQHGKHANLHVYPWCGLAPFTRTSRISRPPLPRQGHHLARGQLRARGIQGFGQFGVDPAQRCVLGLCGIQRSTQARVRLPQVFVHPLLEHQVHTPTGDPMVAVCLGAHRGDAAAIVSVSQHSTSPSRTSSLRHSFHRNRRQS